jgi:hypothetical protein
MSFDYRDMIMTKGHKLIRKRQHDRNFSDFKDGSIRPAAKLGMLKN